MALNWTNKQDGVDFISAEDVNSLAKAIMDNERNINDIKIKPNIEIDDELSSTSTNPVQNKVITAELNKKANKELAFDGFYNVYSYEARFEEGIYIAAQGFVIQFITIGEDTMYYDLDQFWYKGKDVYYRGLGDESGWENDWRKISVSQTDLDNAIGDIETSLNNIIKKYGLGGDSV